ncbi:MAG: hypothetical protein KAS99_04085 [Candidatus Omnitrophica bacterium]|nr:hypothetical protein [Candidatus Omnitrophota bacterium]
MFQKKVFIINTIIIGILFAISSLLSGLIYNALRIMSGLYFNLFFIFILLISVMIFYVIFLLFIIIYYRTLLAFIPHQEDTVYLTEKIPYQTRQQLRTILTGVASDIATPILYYFSDWLKLFGAKVGKNFVLRGKVCNPELLEIGNNVLIGNSSFITAHLKDGVRLIFKKIKIGHNCTIGVKSILFPGVEIGDNSIIGAYSLLPKDMKIPPNQVWAGIPAKKIKDIEIKHSHLDK